MDGASYPMVIIISATSIVGNVADKGAVIYTFTHGGEVVFNSSEVTLNTAITSGVILASHIDLWIVNSVFTDNAGNQEIMYIIDSTCTFFNRTEIVNNLGSLVLYYSNATFQDETVIENSTSIQIDDANFQGGALTAVLINIIFKGTNTLMDNNASIQVVEQCMQLTV